MACSYHATPQAVEDMIRTKVTSCRIPIPRVGSTRRTVYLLALFMFRRRFWPSMDGPISTIGLPTCGSTTDLGHQHEVLVPKKSYMIDKKCMTICECCAWTQIFLLLLAVPVLPISAA